MKIKAWLSLGFWAALLLITFLLPTISPAQEGWAKGADPRNSNASQSSSLPGSPPDLLPNRPAEQYSETMPLLPPAKEKKVASDTGRVNHPANPSGEEGTGTTKRRWYSIPSYHWYIWLLVGVGVILLILVLYIFIEPLFRNRENLKKQKLAKRNLQEKRMSPDREKSPQTVENLPWMKRVPDLPDTMPEVPPETLDFFNKIFGVIEQGQRNSEARLEEGLRHICSRLSDLEKVSPRGVAVAGTPADPGSLFRDLKADRTDVVSVARLGVLENIKMRAIVDYAEELARGQKEFKDKYLVLEKNMLDLQKELLTAIGERADAHHNPMQVAARVKEKIRQQEVDSQNLRRDLENYKIENEKYYQESQERGKNLQWSQEGLEKLFQEIGFPLKPDHPYDTKWMVGELRAYHDNPPVINKYALVICNQLQELLQDAVDIGRQSSQEETGLQALLGLEGLSRQVDKIGEDLSPKKIAELIKKIQQNYSLGADDFKGALNRYIVEQNWEVFSKLLRAAAFVQAYLRGGAANGAEGQAQADLAHLLGAGAYLVRSFLKEKLSLVPQDISLFPSRSATIFNAEKHQSAGVAVPTEFSNNYAELEKIIAIWLEAGRPPEVIYDVQYWGYDLAGGKAKLSKVHFLNDAEVSKIKAHISRSGNS